jgi:hypothetical protein
MPFIVTGIEATGAVAIAPWFRFLRLWLKRDLRAGPVVLRGMEK